MESLFRMLSNLKVGICITNEKGQFVEANDLFCKVFGVSKKDLAGNTFATIVPVSQVKIVDDFHLKIFKSNKTDFLDLSIISKEGIEIFIKLSGEKFEQVKGQNFIITTVVEESSRNHENQLKLSNERYEYVTKATFDAIWDLSLVEEDLYWGDGFESLFGYKTENNKGDIVGWYEHIHEEDRKRVLQSINTLIKSKNSIWVEEYQFKKADGSMAFVRNKGIIVRDNRGKALRMIGAMQDISEQKREEQQLKLFKSVITNSNDSVLISAASSIYESGPEIIYVNDAFLKLTGYSREEVLGKTPALLHGPLTSNDALAKIKTSLENWESCELELINYKKNGAPFWTSIANVPVSDAKGKYTHWISIQKNVTEKIREENEKELFYSLLQIINSNKQLEVAMSIVIEKISEYFGYIYAEAWLVNIDESKMLYKAKWAKNETKALYGIEFPYESVEKGLGMMGKAWEEKKKIYYNDIQNSYFLAKDNARLAGLNSVLVLPIFLNEKIIGFFSFFKETAFTKEQEESDFLDKISLQMGSAIQKSRAEDELNRFFQLSPDLMCIVGLDGYFKKVNHSVCNLLGYSEMELLNAKLNDFIFEPSKETVDTKKPDIFSGVDIFDYENRYLSKSGKVIWLSWTAVPIPDEGVVFAVAKDITEKKKMDLERENILDSISDCFYALDNQFNFTYLNTPAQKLLKKSSAELVGKNIFDIYTFLGEGLFYENFQNVLRTKEPMHFEIYFKDFSSWYEESFYPTEEGISIFFRSINNRKKAEEEIQIALKEKNSILESITDGFLTLDQNWIVTYWNKESERMLQVKRNDIVGKKLTDFFPAVRGTKFYQNLLEAMTVNSAMHFEQFYPPLNLHLEISAYPSEMGLSIYFKNITQAKKILDLEQLEKEVLEKNALPDTALEESIRFYLIEIEKLHPGMICSVMRLEDSKLHCWVAPNLHKEFLDIFEDVEIGSKNGAFDSAAFGKQKVIVSDIEKEIFWKGFKEAAIRNNLKSYWSYPIINNSDTVLGTFAIYYNTKKVPSIEEEKIIFKVVNILKIIIENKTFEQEILEINERYNFVTKATNDIIWDWNIKKDIVFRTGEGLKNLISLSDDSHTNNLNVWTERIHPDDISNTKDWLDNFLYHSTELFWTNSYRFKKSDGKYAYLYEKGYLTRNEKLVPVRMIGSIRDITLQKETEMVLKSLNDKLEKRAEQLINSNLELERFAYIASHDLQEPLRMVSSFLQLLQKKYEHQLDEIGNKYIHLAVDGADRMKRLINDLLQFSRVSSTIIALQPVDTQQIVDDLKILFKNKLFESGGIIYTSKLPLIMADKTPISQLFQNLLGNALKYKSESPPEIHVTCVESKLDYTFCVSDNGIGIDPKFFEKIFVIFQRLHSKNEYSGTGIGLAICKKIADRFNGKIWVESAQGKGSKFFFSFPKL